MRNMLLILSLGLPALASAQTIFKCTAPDGSISMQQTLCPSTSKAETSRGAPPASPTRREASPPRRAAAPGAVVPATPGDVAPPAPEAKRHWLVWSGDPATDAVRATANLDSIRALGLMCESGLRAGGNDGDACQRFLAQLAPAGDYTRVVDKVRELLGNPMATQGGSGRELRRAEPIRQDIVRLHEFVRFANPR